MDDQKILPAILININDVMPLNSYKICERYVNREVI